MNLTDLVPDPEALIAYEPDERGLVLLPLFSAWPRHTNLQLSVLLGTVLGPDLVPGQAPGSAGLYPREFRSQIDEALREAWAWLEGAALLVPHPNHSHSIKRLSRKAKKLASADSRDLTFSIRRLPKDTLLPELQEDVWSLFHRGQFEIAVFAAMKAVEVAVRGASGLNDEIGVPLMRRAFDKNTGPLTDMSATEGEREMRAHLFAGAIGSYKNPHSHRDVRLEDPHEAAEIILLANHLLRIVSKLPLRS